MLTFGDGGLAIVWSNVQNTQNDLLGWYSFRYDFRGLVDRLLFLEFYHYHQSALLPVAAYLQLGRLSPLTAATWP